MTVVGKIEPHQHQWRMQMHIDGCHFHSSTYVCECGTRMETFSEREVASDSYSLMWLLPDECERCKELLDGAEPIHSKDLIEP